jgi:hypothetical protein
MVPADGGVTEKFITRGVLLWIVNAVQVIAIGSDPVAEQPGSIEASAEDVRPVVPGYTLITALDATSRLPFWVQVRPIDVEISVAVDLGN